MTARPRIVRFRWVAGLVLLATMFGCSGLANRLILHPRREVERYPGTERIRFEGVRVGHTVDVYRTTQDGAEFAVLALHGNAGLATRTHQSAQACFAGTPIDVWSVEYPGYGESDGAATMAGAAAAALDAFEFVRGQVDLPLIVFGRSFGGAVALHVAAEFADTDAIVLEKPPPFRKLVLGRHGWWNLWLLALPVAFGVPSQLVAGSNAARIETVPAVFCIATEDDIVPASYVEPIAAAYRGPRRVIRRATTHGAWFPLAPADLDWLRAAIRRASPL